MTEVRYEVAGFVIRYFRHRKDAIAAANARTKLTQEQHEPFPHQDLYLVENVVTRALYDVNGALPKPVVEEVRPNL